MRVPTKVGFIAVFASVVLALAAPVRASDYYFTLYSNSGLRFEMYINYLGSGGPVYAVHGFIPQPGRNIPITGTVILETPTTARFGITLQNGLAGINPVGWEFTCNINTWQCSGGWVHYTAPESRGVATLSQTPPFRVDTSPEAAAEALRSIGIVK